jgi:putative AlgH/UPF0301 family transcriptional regulator
MVSESQAEDSRRTFPTRNMSSFVLYVGGPAKRCNQIILKRNDISRVEENLKISYKVLIFR